jgi:Glucose dehydrogenase
MWSIPTVDTERGIAFLPLTSPSYDYYGGDRKGAGLYGDSLVAVDALTGKRIWHFQTVHHNLWDYDLPAQPTLVTVLRAGKLVDAVAQVTKTGFTFVFERATGKPLFDIVEKPVPASDVPGESAYPTQPFPVKPQPFARQSFRAEDLTDVTPESRAYCGKLSKARCSARCSRPWGPSLRCSFLAPTGAPIGEAHPLIRRPALST